MLHVEKKFLPFGVVQGRSVVIDQVNFYGLGNFGTGSLSRSKPVYDAQPQFLDDVLTKQKKTQLLEQIHSFREHNKDVLAREPKEVLLLTLHEAFFLVFALGSLQVIDHHQCEKPLTVRQCWKLFCELEGTDMFVSRYAAYHYYRSRGWIPRSGVKYGCDFVLYKRGPEVDHAQFCVRVVVQKRRQVLAENMTSTQNVVDTQIDSVSWLELQHQCRLSVTVSKNLLLCCVTMNENAELPDDTLIKNYLSNEVSISHIKVNRFQPERDRE